MRHSSTTKIVVKKIRFLVNGKSKVIVRQTPACFFQLGNSQFSELPSEIEGLLLILPMFSCNRVKLKFFREAKFLETHRQEEQ